MKISVTVTGYIDVPDDWDDGQYSALDIANYRYSNQLTVEDALQEIAQKMASHPDDVEVSIRPREVREPLTCGLVDRHGMPLRAGDTVAADKFFVYAVRYGSHNVNPDNCAPAYQVGWYLEIMWAYPGFEDSVGHTEPLYDIDGTAARYPAHCADTADGLYNLKLEVCCRPPEGEEDT